MNRRSTDTKLRQWLRDADNRETAVLWTIAVAMLATMYWRVA